MDAKKGTIGNFIRVILVLENVFFFLFGIFLLILSAAIKGNKISFINDFIQVANRTSIFDLDKIPVITTYTLIIAIVLLAISAYGLFSLFVKKRIFIAVYGLLAVLLFSVQNGIIMYVIMKFSTSEITYTVKLNKLVESINQSNLTLDDSNDCASFLILSRVLKCCGSMGPSDFTSLIVREKCCHDQTYKDGCSRKAFDILRTNGLFYVIIPYVVVCFLDLLSIVSIVVFYYKNNKNNKNDNSVAPQRF